MNEDRTLFSVGEIAKMLGITRRIILNYEDRGLIKPDTKHGVNGNRYYTIDTFTQIRMIRLFQKLNLSLDEIRDYFDGSTDLMTLIKRLESMRDEINLSIEKLYERINNNKIKEICVKAQTVYKRVLNSKTIAEKTEYLRNTALEATKSYGMDITRRMYFTEFNLNNMEDVSYCVAIPEESEGEFVVKMDELYAISTFYHGGYENIGEATKRLIKYANEKNIKIKGICRHVYIEGPPQHKDPKRFITQVLLPIER